MEGGGVWRGGRGEGMEKGEGGMEEGKGGKGAGCQDTCFIHVA